MYELSGVKIINFMSGYIAKLVAREASGAPFDSCNVRFLQKTKKIIKDDLRAGPI